jgi:HEAT repeat protein
VVVCALNLLEAAGPELVETPVLRLLDHPAPAVRRDALQRAERLCLTPALSTIRRRVAVEPVATVRGAAVKALAVLGQDQVIDEVALCLEDAEPAVRKGALVGLLRGGGMGGQLAARRKLQELVDSRLPADRMVAAEVVGEAGARGSSGLLLTLLSDSDARVQRAALLAAGRLKDEYLWPVVLQKLGSQRVRGPAATALVAGGAQVLPGVAAAFDREGERLDVLAQLVKVIGRIGGDRAITWLKGRLAFRDAGIRTHVLRGLARSGYKAAGDEATGVRQRIDAEAAQSTDTLAALVAVGDGPAVGLLREALVETLAQDQARLMVLLSFIHDRRSILQACDCLSHPSTERRAYALEVIDALVSQELKRIVLPLLDEMPASQKLARLEYLFPVSRWDSRQWLRELASGRSDHFGTWTRACALYAIGGLPAPELSDSVVAALSAAEPLVRETATLTLSRLEGLERRHMVAALEGDADPAVVRFARALSMDEGQEGTMLSTIEKVIALKAASIFAETPDEALADLATYVDEIVVGGGECILQKGDLGDSMYVIVVGEVRVHDGQRTLNHLGEGDVFGEMAVLDTGPRVASVTAVVDTRLLRLDQETLYELMDAHIDVAQGIIRVLSRHLRHRVKDLNDLRGLVAEQPRSKQGY